MTLRRLLVPGAFACLLAAGAIAQLGVEKPNKRQVEIAAQRLLPPEEPGVLPTEWIRGLDCSSDPTFQVHEYNENLYIIRQSKCATFEAPFLYLIFGEDRALLMDTGSAANTPLAATVGNVVQEWLARNGKTSIPLIVGHTHSHGDHTQGDNQFIGSPFVETVVGLSLNEVRTYWNLPDYPNDTSTIDLGNRVIDVLGTPGHQPASITLYDRKTHLLLTGDIVYPGHLFVFSPQEWPDFYNSIDRLVDWAATHPVEWVLGCHIEMGAAPFDSYAWGTPMHPNEAPLEFKPDILTDILAAATEQGLDPECTIYDRFVIHPVYKCGITWNN